MRSSSRSTVRNCAPRSERWTSSRPTMNWRTEASRWSSRAGRCRVTKFESRRSPLPVLTGRGRGWGSPRSPQRSRILAATAPPLTPPRKSEEGNSRRLIVAPSRSYLPRKLLVLQPVRHDAVDPEPPLLVFLVIRKIPFEPFHMRVVFEGEHMGGDAVEEEAIVGDDDCAAREIE